MQRTIFLVGAGLVLGALIAAGTLLVAVPQARATALPTTLVAVAGSLLGVVLTLEYQSKRDREG